MIRHIQKSNITHNEQGLVSFMVVTVIMAITTLIVMSYARVVRREQVQTADRQLNVQALYAAESAVNDAMNALNTTPSLATGGPYNNCDDFTTAAGLASNLGNNVAYSCLLVDTSPTRLDYDGVNTNSSTVIPLRSTTNIDTVEISWDSDVPSPTTNGCASNLTLPAPWPNDCQIGMIRFELLPFIATGMTRDSIISDTAVGFLKPYDTGGANNGSLSSFQQSAGSNDKGEIVGVRCNSTSPRRCVFRITGINTNQAYLRVKSEYRNTPLTIRAFDNASTPLGLRGAQVVFDVTGRAAGVLKRIKVNKQVPNGNTGIAPEFALQSKNTLCKQFTYRPGVVAPQNAASECDPSQP